MFASKVLIYSTSEAMLALVLVLSSTKWAL